MAFVGDKFPDYPSDPSSGISVALPFFRNSGRDFPIMQSYDIQAGPNGERLSKVLQDLKNAISGGVASTGKPIEVPTSEKMDEILSSASAASVGTVYKYMGNTTGIYEHGAIYIISEAILDGDGVKY